MANWVWKGYLGAPVNLSKISFFNLRSRSMRKGCLGEAEKKMKKSVRGSKCWGAEVSEDWSIWGPKRQGAEASEVQCLPLTAQAKKHKGVVDHFYDFCIHKMHHFYYFWIQKPQYFCIIWIQKLHYFWKCQGAEASGCRSIKGPKPQWAEALDDWSIGGQSLGISWCQPSY